MLPNALGERLTPSAVAVDDRGELFIGAAAKALSVTRPDRAATLFKRDMGTDALRQLFRLALEGQRRAEIDACRADLNALIETFRQGT